VRGHPWTLPRGRSLLAGVANLAVLVAILVVFTQDVPQRTPSGTAEPFGLQGATPQAGDATSMRPWTEVPLAETPSELGPGLARPVEEELAAVRERIARCVEVDRRRGERSGASSGAPPSQGPARLVLRLAPRSGAIHVQGLEITSPGASPAVLACARRLLDGDAIAAAAAVPGRRYRLALALE
jgi:hypothetical protein